LTGVRAARHASVGFTRTRPGPTTMCAMSSRGTTSIDWQWSSETITIEASPVTYSCAANAHVTADGQGNRAFDKNRSRGRIDGIVTIAMATGAATMNEQDDAGLDDFLANPLVA